MLCTIYKTVTFKDLQKVVQSHLQSSLEQKKLFERFLNKPFWIWSQQQHKLLDITTNGDCCFNHIISLPRRTMLIDHSMTTRK